MWSIGCQSLFQLPFSNCQAILNSVLSNSLNFCGPSEVPFGGALTHLKAFGYFGMAITFYGMSQIFLGGGR